MHFYLEDTIETKDQRFAVWDLETGKEVYVSSDLGTTRLGVLNRFTLRLSASAHWALVRRPYDLDFGEGQVWLYHLKLF
jgi:hypothetical protein